MTEIAEAIKVLSIVIALDGLAVTFALFAVGLSIWRRR